MSIILNLQQDIIKNEKTLTELLREVLLISSKLKLNDFKSWINSELKGYENNNVPEYRRVRSNLKFLNPDRGWITAITTNEIDDIINTHNVLQSIAELEDLIYNNKDSELILSLTSSQKSLLMKSFKTNFEPECFVSKTQISNIIEQVKTTLLEWVLKLEENGILGDENMIFTNEEQTKAKHIHIENFNGVLGNIDNVGNIASGDYNQNNSNINNNIELQINKLLKEIQKLDLPDKEEIIAEIENSRNNSSKLIKVLGELLTRSSELATVAPFIGDILRVLSS